MTFCQLPQMLRHLKERGIALLSCGHGDDLAGVLPRPRHGCLPGFLVGSAPVARQAS